MDWWIVKQLRAQILEDLREFVPQGYFESEVEKFYLNDGIKKGDSLPLISLQLPPMGINREKKRKRG